MSPCVSNERSNAVRQSRGLSLVLMAAGHCFCQPKEARFTRQAAKLSFAQGSRNLRNSVQALFKAFDEMQVQAHMCPYILHLTCYGYRSNQFGCGWT